MKKETKVDIKAVDVKNTTINIRGLSPLLIHKFSDEAKQSMLGKQTGKTKSKELRNIEAEIEACKYYTEEGAVGFPASGFKKAMVEAAPYLDGLDKKLVKGSVYVMGNLVPINFKREVINEAVVHLSGRGSVSMVRYRPEFREWSAALDIQFDASLMSPQHIVALINTAGFHIGVGDWRPQKSGSYGMFEVVQS